MKSKICNFFKFFFVPEVFWMILFSGLLGYIIAFCGFASISAHFNLDLVISKNIFESVTANKYFFSLVVIIDLIIFLLYFFNHRIYKNFNKHIILSILALLILWSMTMLQTTIIQLIYIRLSLMAVGFSLLAFVLLGEFLKRIPKRYYHLIMWGIVIIFIILYSLLSVVKYDHYGGISYDISYDLAIYDQVIYHYAHFNIGSSSVRGFENILGDHFNPILVVFAPLYWLWSNPKILLIAQAILVAIAACPLFLIIKNKLNNSLASIFIASSYLIFIGTIAAVNFDFHTIILFPLFFLLAYYFLENKKYLMYFVMVFVLFLCKEDIPIYMTFFGIFLLFFKNKKIGFYTILMSVASYLLITKLIIPHFAHGDFAYFQFNALGNNIGEAIRNIIRNPGFIFNVAIDNPMKVQTLWTILASFGFLIIFSPIYLFLALPMLAEQLLYNRPANWAIHNHFTIAIAPILILGCAEAIKFLSKNLKKYFQFVNTENVILVLGIFILFSSTIMGFYMKNPLLIIFRSNYYVKQTWMKDNDEIIKLIPPEASVVAQLNMVSHISERELAGAYKWAGDKRLENPDFYLFALEGYSAPIASKLEKINTVIDMLKNPNYGLYSQIGDSFLFKRNYLDADKQESAKIYLEKLKAEIN